MKSKIFIITAIAILFNLSFVARAQETSMNIEKARIIISNDLRSPLKETCIKVLQEEVGKRTAIDLPVSAKWSDDKMNIVLCLNTSKKVSGKEVPAVKEPGSPVNKEEGFRLLISEKDNAVWIVGADERGVLFGIGEFLRKADMTKGVITVKNTDVITSPAYPLRGHQLGYRNTANSYDAWDIKQYEQYIRDLAIFGNNAIENIPPLEDDKSVHFKISREDMDKAISRICKNYGMYYWEWTPIKADLTKPEEYAAELKKHVDHLKSIPYLSDIFIPGGDPGHNHPRDVLPFIRDLQKELVKYHPDAGIWLSLQGFSEEQVDYFYKYIDENMPVWLRGVVSGPSSPNEAETRYRLPKRYKHRLYPDITHNVRCQFPPHNFDQALALTIGREGINPMPVFYAKVFHDYTPFSDGFVTYSDGCHDDVNKVIWSALGWAPDKDINEIITDYARYFFEPEVAQSASAGIFALEKNWSGPLKDNGSVEATLRFWKDLDKAHPELKDNWRWQMLQLRAVYDAYERRRLIIEKGIEKDANKILADVDKLGIDKAMNMALDKITETERNPVSPDLRKQIPDYCEQLFQSIGLQTSVEKYAARGAERGAILDFVDYPLNNRWWYEDEFKKIRAMRTDDEKKKRLEVIRTWENPGPGSYYDDISNIANSPHVRSIVDDATDFAWWDNGKSRRRLSTQVFQNQPVLEYKNLDPNARYLIRVSGYGDALIRVDGQRLEPTIYNKEFETFKEFIVPRRLVGDMEIKVTFDQPEESQLNWRNYSKVTDVWLIKR